MTVNLDDFVAITGASGLYRVVASRKDGAIVEDLTTKQNKFFSSRLYKFLPLSTVGIYVDDEVETIKLGDVLAIMFQQKEALPIPKSAATDVELRDYLLAILPNHDRYRVKNSDIKKLVKWFTFLDDRNLLKLEEEAKKEDKKTEE